MYHVVHAMGRERRDENEGVDGRKDEGMGV